MGEDVQKKKYCLLGEGAVGKTSLIKRFVTDEFDDRYITTIGTKVTKKSIVRKGDDGPTRVDMMVWDIMGQQGYRAMLQQAYFSGTAGAIAVCDVTRPETLVALDDWVYGLRKVCGEVPVVLFANKADLKNLSQIKLEELRAFAEQYGATSYFTSAKTGANVEKGFMDMMKATV